jgi:hypothetical protein
MSKHVQVSIIIPANKSGVPCSSSNHVNLDIWVLLDLNRLSHVLTFRDTESSIFALSPSKHLVTCLCYSQTMLISHSDIGDHMTLQALNQAWKNFSESLILSILAFLGEWCVQTQLSILVGTH